MNNTRAIFVIASVIIFFIALAVKLFDIQVLKSEELKYYAERQQTRMEKIKAERGLIYDRNNVLLAFNRNDVSFFIDLRMATKKIRNDVAIKFASVFGKNKKYYMNLMQGKDKTVCIEKKAPGEKALLLKNYKAVGLFSKDDPTRVYQYDKLASHVLGYVDNEYNGVNGIEKSCQEELRGEDGAMLVERDAIGDMLTVAEDQTRPAQTGETIILTINKSYQAILEDELHKGVEEYKAGSGIGIVMDPATGEILALANVGDYDPNTYWLADDESRRNRALTDTYEPGSTFKSITLAALFDQNLCHEEDNVFTENGKYKYKNVIIRDTHNHDWLTVKGVMEQSSNVGVSKLVQKIDDELYYKYLRGFGFGNYTSSELPGEAKGTLKKPNLWTPITKAFMSFGYELSVTPMQMIAAYAAIINGGTLYQPMIIKRKINNGTVTVENSPKQVRTVISKETSDRMRKIMQSIVENGTGKNAKLDFMTIGGKTGTSQKLVDGKYSSSHYNSSFIGFFPVENPQVICLVLLNSPQVGGYGGLVAAPIFKNVVSRIIISDPDKFDNPSYKIKSPLNDIKIAKQDHDGQNNKNKTDTIELVKPKIVSMNVMPDLTNSSVRDAMVVLNKLGIKYKISGSGRIISQSINAGDKISRGATCSLNCEEIMVSGTAVVY